MSKPDATIPTFTLAEFDAADTATMEVLIGGKPSGWFWEFAGPGHEKTEAQKARVARERLRKSAEIERAQVNGRKWKPEEDAPETVVARNVADIVERIVGWSTVEIDGKPFPFTPQNATFLLSDPKRVSLLEQASEFLWNEQSFTGRSA